MSQPFEIAVVGSLNLDISVVVPSLPLPGETVLGGDALWNGGGKGANQAVAAAKLGRRVAMIGAVGDDSAGTDLLTGLTGHGVDVGEVAVLADTPSGLAMIVVDEQAENSIVVSPGANNRVGADQINASAALRDAAIVLVQYEIPAEAVNTVAERAAGRLVVNPAPARATSEAVLAAARAIVPNRGELALLVGAAEASSTDELVDQARALGCGGAVVITLGSAGALIVESDAVLEIPARSVTAIDTTAAGDSFCGALADALVDNATLRDAVSWATKAAALTVTRRGAQVSLPTRNEIV